MKLKYIWWIKDHNPPKFSLTNVLHTFTMYMHTYIHNCVYTQNKSSQRVSVIASIGS